MSVNDARPDLSDPFSLIMPTLSAGARALRDRIAYTSALMVLAITVLPGVLLWALIVNNTTSPGALAAVTILAFILIFFGYLWTWMALSVRAASVERGAPLGAWPSAMTGLGRLFVTIGGWLILAVIAIPLALLYLLAYVMAGVTVLSLLSVLLTAVVVLGIFVWVLAMLLVSYTLAAFAAGDHRAGVMAVLRRAVGLAVTNPAAVILLLIVTWLTASILSLVLLLPGWAALLAGFGIVAEMSFQGENISADLLSALLGLFYGVLLLVPLLFFASTLAAFAVRIEPELARLEESGANARQALSGKLKRARADEGPGGAPPPAGWQGGPPPGGPQPGGPPQGFPPQGGPPQGGPPQGGPPPGGPQPGGPPQGGPPPQGFPPQGGPPQGGPPPGGPQPGGPPQGGPPQGGPPPSGPPPQ